MATDPTTLFRLDKETALVTGGGSGIGEAVARLFAGAGAHVAVADRDGAAARRVASEIGGSAMAVEVDVAEADQVTQAVATIESALGPISILVNSAGVAIRKTAFDLTPEEWDLVLAVNLKGTFLCARAAAASMKARGGGAIVNIASIMGLSGGLYPNPAYQASKGGVVNLTRALAIEWAPFGIRVNAVAPTFVRTPFIGALTEDPVKMAEIRAATPLGRLAEPEEVAAAVLFLASPASSMTTGHVLAVDGGFLAR